jgi:endonuclease/exonuclease/phosphatase (EEP) superfamily protein YafD
MRDMTALQDSLGVSTKGAAGTWPAGLPAPLRLPLDLVFVGRGLILRNSTPGPDLGSAHLPIIAEITARTE